MSDPFIAEIRMVGFNFPPKGWARCDGQLLPIAQNTALFSLLGTYYGGDGQRTFALPDLQGRAPMAVEQGQFDLGSLQGSERVDLYSAQMPAHVHSLNAVAAAGTTSAPSAAFLAQGNRQAGPVKRNIKLYRADNPDSLMSAQELGPAGSSEPHNNMQPYLTLMFVIAQTGIFPSHS